jgi:hypothetical protein
MRWVNRSAVVAALLAAACGNYSTEDLVFLAALPERKDLRAEVPPQGTSGALSVCTIGSAEVWLRSKPASDGWNAAVDFVIGLIDTVREHAPTTRDDDVRAWGPFDDARHPGREIRVVIVRTYPQELEGKPRYAYAFQGRVKGTDGYTDLITGAFDGRSASRGKGLVTLDFDALWTIGMNDPDTPRGTLYISYDRTADPARLALTLAQDGFGIVQFTYGYTGYADGTGAFAYRFRNAQGDVLTVQTSFDTAGSGRDRVNFVGAGGGTASFDQCWDASACLVYVYDPLDVTGVQVCAAPPCPPVGDLGACPAVPASPF